jgi:hypothetical protein
LADRKISGESVTNKVGERLFLCEGRTLYELLPAVVERVVVSDPKTLLIGEEHLATMPRDTLGAPNAV